MEACLHHWIKNKKGNCDFLPHNSDFFHRIVRYKLAILTFFLRIIVIKSELREIK